MNKLVLLFSILASSTIALSADVNQLAADVEKKFHQSYPLESEDEIYISNQFGDVEVRLWDKSEIEVDVTITASAKNMDRAQAILDQIEINTEKVGRKITFETSIGKRSKGIKSKGSQGFSIDYDVRIPNNFDLEIKNQFGKIIVPDYDGEINLTSQFGGIDGGKLSNPYDINVEFGYIDLDQLNGGNSTVKFSKADIREVNGDLDLRFEFCNDVVLEAGTSFEGLSLKASNSDIDLKVSSSFSGDFDIRTSFGSFKNKTNFSFSDNEEKGDFNINFDGHFQGSSGNGNVPVRIKSSFSKIRLTH